MSGNSSFVQGRLFPDLSSTKIKQFVSNTSNVTEGECVPLQETYVQVVSSLPAIVVVENGLFLYAVIHYRATLKHNNVYRYVASALAANIVLSAFGFYHFINYYYAFEARDPNSWWAFRKGLTLALSLTLLGNIGLLIYGIEESFYMVGRSVLKHDHSKRWLDPQKRRRKATMLICVVWALPTIYGLLAMTSWNCVRFCNCTLSYRDGRHICSHELCSEIYTPMSKTYLLVVCILWFVECVVLATLLVRSIFNFRHSKQSIAGTTVNFRKTLAAYSASHCVIFLLFGLFVACTAPIMILFTLDFALPAVHFDHMLINFVTPLPVVYCVLSPFLLTHRLPGLRSAVQMTVSVSMSRASSMRTKDRIIPNTRMAASTTNGSSSSETTPV